MSEEDFMNKYNLKKAENTEDYLIGEYAGIEVALTPEAYKEAIKQKTIYENEILNDLQNQNIELQERIDKAIEYIEHKRLYEEVVDYDFEENPIYVGANCEKARTDLLNILKGEE